MNLQQAKTSIDEMVMSYDAGEKMIPSVGTPHGPYRLLKITKAGLAILEGREKYRIPPSLLQRHTVDIKTCVECFYVCGFDNTKCPHCEGVLSI